MSGLCPDDRDWWRSSALVKILGSIFVLYGALFVVFGVIGLTSPALVEGLINLLSGILTLFFGFSLLGFFGQFWRVLSSSFSYFVRSLPSFFILIFIRNKEIRRHRFLATIFQDNYYPKSLIHKGKNILLRLCAKIESIDPQSTHEVYALTQDATKKLNLLAEKFIENRTRLGQTAGDAIVQDFDFIFKTYKLDLNLDQAMLFRSW